MTEHHMKAREDAGSFRSFFRHVKYEHLLAGLSGGVCSTLALHPLDVIKVRLQAYDGVNSDPHRSYSGLRHAFRSIYMEHGWKGFYQGVIPNLWGAGLAWGLYFFGFNFLKDAIKGDKRQTLTAKEHLITGILTGAGTLSLTNPIWVTKTRLIVQNDSANHASKSTHYHGMIDTLIKTWKHEGIQGLYKGFLPGLFGVSHGALQFMAYEELKKFHSSYFGTPVDKKLSSSDYIVMAALSKIFASATTYPYQVVRTRLQDQYNIERYNGALDVVIKTWRFEGFRGFYKGLFPNLLRVTPACCITFVTYENVLSLLQSENK
ncbi:mitochondrial folate transporter/carrier-like [Xenia sp. Carnegie-2017]|uniref:mitochondrial folate transporter/carrier-like n=1 Tax=Xenia sp. Carnegie-2017 TaxID=2897299 RepID=UPI001F03C221|nr:mitochondrial folate transporter/carrier-like [Xenia sp. Carnegie-2017]